MALPSAPSQTPVSTQPSLGKPETEGGKHHGRPDNLAHTLLGNSHNEEKRRTESEQDTHRTQREKEKLPHQNKAAERKEKELHREREELIKKDATVFRQEIAPHPQSSASNPTANRGSKPSSPR